MDDSLFLSGEDKWEELTRSRMEVRKQELANHQGYRHGMPRHPLPCLAGECMSPDAGPGIPREREILRRPSVFFPP